MFCTLAKKYYSTVVDIPNSMPADHSCPYIRTSPYTSVKVSKEDDVFALRDGCKDSVYLSIEHFLGFACCIQCWCICTDHGCLPGINKFDCERHQSFENTHMLFRQLGTSALLTAKPTPCILGSFSLFPFQ